VLLQALLTRWVELAEEHVTLPNYKVLVSFSRFGRHPIYGRIYYGRGLTLELKSCLERLEGS
jgi:hypothetical protein